MAEDGNLSDGFVIVIGRQFGSGGRRIGKIIAQRLGIAYYDTELLRKAAESEGVSPEIYKDHDEKRPSVLKAILQGVYGIADNFHTVPLSGERIYNVQGKVIRDLSKKGSCVIVGRGADVILKGHPRLLSVFLHAPLEYRIDRILERGEALTREEAEELANRRDKNRESFYNYFCGDKKWGVANNYHLSLDTSRLTNEEAADIIISSLIPRK
ncbi:MAG: cytidylate kinase-like family protein [Muribaculaceae bacterium]|nr:cytidylate kinase-like family protein [Muribaculaceae bacterium]